MQSHPGAGDNINSYALVSYIPGPLGQYLDRIRRELVTSCVAQSHVTILPPRSLASVGENTRIELSEALQDYHPFSLELGGIEVFESTSVIYISVERGREDLKYLHSLLNRDSLFANEFHAYHPHVTLAQDFPPQEMADMLELAKSRWAEFRHRKGFEVERLTFVQNTTTNHWLDLGDFPLGHPVLSSQ